MKILQFFGIFSSPNAIRKRLKRANHPPRKGYTGLGDADLRNYIEVCAVPYTYLH